MEKKDLKLENLVAAAVDLNKVLDLNPAILVEFDGSPFKGIALINARKKFVTQLGKDLVELATGKTDKGEDMIQPIDVLEPATIDVLDALGVKEIRKKMVVASGKKVKGEKTMKPKGEKTMKPKGEKVVKPKGEKKEKELSRYGHRIGSQAAQLDDILFRGSAVDQAAVALGVAESRVKSHISYLRGKGVKIVKNERTGVWMVVR